MLSMTYCHTLTQHIRCFIFIVCSFNARRPFRRAGEFGSPLAGSACNSGVKSKGRATHCQEVSCILPAGEGDALTSA